jgi:hypothetical protein
MRYLVAAVDAVQLDPSEMERQIPGVQWETISQY